MIALVGLLTGSTEGKACERVLIEISWSAHSICAVVSASRALLTTDQEGRCFAEALNRPLQLFYCGSLACFTVPQNRLSEP